MMRPPWLGGKPRLRNYERVTKSGFSFSSKLESSVHDHLLILEKAGEIRDIRLQQTIYLTEARIGMRPDFLVTDSKTEQDYFVEAKGHDAEVWQLKLRLYRYYGPLPLHIYRGSYKKPYLHEVVIPKRMGA